MTIATNDRRKLYTGDGVATAFNGPSSSSASCIQVYLDGVPVVAGYTVTNLGGTSTTVTFATAPSNGVSIVIMRTMPLTQETDVANQGALLAQAHEAAFDERVQQIQPIADHSTLVVKLPVTLSNSGEVPNDPFVASADAQGAEGDGTTLADDTLLRADLADPSPAKGGALVAFKRQATGAVSRTVFDKLSEELSVKDFGAVGDGVTNDTAAIQAALNAVGSNKVLRINHGIYLVSATLYAPYGATIIGDGFEFTQIYRTGDYGDTLVFGAAAAGNAGGPGRVADIWFRHGDAYVTGDASLNYLATSGAHLHFYGCQRAVVENCWLWRLPYQILFDGGSVITVSNCSFNGTYDHTVPALQEGQAQVYLRKNANYGSPTTVRIENCKFNGNNVNARNVTLASGDGSVVRSMTELIGSVYGLLCDGGEDIEINGGYFGGLNNSCVLFNPGSSSIVDIRIHNVHFDGARGSQVSFVSSGTEGSLGVTISNNIFNGEVLSGHAVSMVGSIPVVTNFTITGNSCFQHYKTNFFINAARGGYIGSNVISSYNTLDAATTDGQWVAGVACYNAYTRDIQIGPNVIGGGGNLFDISTSNTYTYKGIEIDSACVRVTAVGVQYAGIRDGSNFRTGSAQTTGQRVSTSAENWQMKGNEDIYIRQYAATNANTVTLPQYPMMGREVVIKDGQGNAATYAISINTSDGSAIDGSATSSVGTNYGAKRLRFNGAQWNVIG